MNNQELLEDIKQIINARASATEAYIDQQVGGIEQRIDRIEQSMATKTDVQALEKRMDEKIDTVLNAVGERFNAAEEAIEAQQWKALERRIQVLEQLTTKLA